MGIREVGAGSSRYGVVADIMGGVGVIEDIWRRRLTTIIRVEAARLMTRSGGH